LTELFERPKDDLCLEYEAMPPFAYGVEVWYDAPVHNPHVWAVSDFLDNNKPRFVVKGTVGLSKADVPVAEGNILFDTGATSCFVDSFWLSSWKPDYKKKLKHCDQSLQLANGTKQQIEGLIRLGIKLGNYAGSVLCYVVDLRSYNVILGITVKGKEVFH
jgi:hypothetical protein